MTKFLVSVAILLIAASWASFVRAATLRQHETQPSPATVPTPPPGQEIDLEGILDIYIADNFENHQEEHVYLLRHTSGETHHLIFDEKAPRALHTGAFVRVKGHSHDHQRVKHAMSDKHKAAKVTQIDMLHESKFDMSESNMKKKKRSITEGLNPAELRRVAVIITDFRDKKVGCSKQSIEQLMWGSNRQDTSLDDDWANNKRSYEVNTFGEVSFARATTDAPQADIFGPFQVDLDLEKEKRCRPEEWSWGAMEAAKAAGVPLGDYRHLMFILPESDYISGTLCKWNGLGNIGCGVQCKTWIGNCDKLGVYVHELGHNYGLHHSAINNDFRGPVVEYGDPTSIMGNQWWSSDRTFYFTAPHRIQNGWIDADRVLRVSSDGDYSLAPMNRLPHRVDPQAITILAPDMLYLNPQPYYVLSFSAGEKAVYSGKLLLHIYYNSSSNSALIWTFDREGGLWRDPSVSFSIRLTEKTDERIRVSIKFGCQLGITQVTAMTPPAASNARYPVFVASPTGFQAVLNSSEVLDAARNLKYSQSARARRNTAAIDRDELAISFPALTSQSSTGPLNLFLDSLPDSFTSVNGSRYLLYMQDYTRKFNITLNIYNRDSPVCTPTFYSFNFLTVPKDWTISCDPKDKLLLVGDQECSLKCLINTPAISRTTDIGKNFSIVMVLNGANSSYSSPLRSGFHEFVFVYPFTCQRSAPTAWIADGASVSVASLSASPGQTASVDLYRANPAIISPPTDAIVLETPRSNATTAGVTAFVAFRNNDSPFCTSQVETASRSFFVTLSNSSSLYWTIEGSPNYAVNLKPQSISVLAVRLKPKATFQNESLDSLPLSFSINETTIAKVGETTPAGVYIETANATVNVLPPCDDVPMLIELTPDPGNDPNNLTALSIEARSSGYVQVNIINARKSLLCGATTFEVRASSSSAVVTTASVPLRSSWPVGPGEVSRHKIAISTSDGIEASSVNADHRVTITIRDLSTNAVVTKVVAVRITRPPCTREQPQFSASCPGQITVDIKNPPPGIVTGPDAWKSGLDVIRCNMFFRNVDEWTCPDRTFQIFWNQSSMSLDSMEFIRNVTFDYEFYRHFPGNYTFSTFYAWFNRSVPFINETMSFTSYFEVYMTNEASPPIVTGISTLSGACQDFPPTITTQNPVYDNITIFSGGVGVYYFTVASFNNRFCGDRLYDVKLDPARETELRAQKWDFSFAQRVRRAGDVYGLIQPPPGTEGVYNLTWVVIDTTNSSLSANVTVFVYVNSSCGIYEPLVQRLDAVTLEPITDAAVGPLPFGQRQILPFVFNVTNIDTKNCSDSLFGFGPRLDTTPRIPGTISVARDVQDNVILPPGNSTLVYINATMENSVFPNTYGLTLEVRSSEITHNKDFPATWRITCPSPTPVTGLFVEERNSSLGTTGFNLQWQGCRRDGDCCCPCKFDIFRDGKKIATTEYQNFTYTPTLAQVGLSFEFTVHVIDKDGRRSPNETCGITVSQKLRASDLDYLVIFLVLIGGILSVPALVFVIEFLRLKGYVY